MAKKVETRPLTLRIPEPIKGKCSCKCPLSLANDGIYYCSFAYYKAIGPKWKERPGPGCPWYEEKKK